MGVSICGVKYNFFLFRLARPFFQKYQFSEGKSTFFTFSCLNTYTPRYVIELIIEPLTGSNH
jgi:hypothetical protein